MKSYWYKRGTIVHLAPIYGAGFVADGWAISRPGDARYEALAAITSEMLPESLAAVAARLLG